ncbi:MAG TPA: glycosyl hydrolase family 28-related protein [Gemmataceae bacterium]
MMKKTVMAAVLMVAAATSGYFVARPTATALTVSSLAISAQSEVNIATRYGAVAGQDSTAAFQKACDDIYASKQPTTIYVPGNPRAYRISAPILADSNYVKFRGDGRYNSVLQSTTYNPILQFGVSRAPAGVPVNRGSWQSAKGILDTTCNANYGLRTFGNQWAAFSASPYAFGPINSKGTGVTLWKGVQTLTIDFCVNNNDGAWLNQQYALFGTLEFNKPSPFYCYIGNLSWMYFGFVTSDGVSRQVAIPLGKTPPLLLKCSIQIDLAAGTIQVWVNRKQVSLTMTRIGAGWGPGLSFNYNHNSIFMIGGVGNGATQPHGLIGPSQGGEDMTYFGMKFSKVKLYNDNGAGTSQTRIDSQTITDFQQFVKYESSASTLVLLQLLDSGNNYRRIPWLGNGAIGYGMWVTANDNSAKAQTFIGNGVSNLGLQISNAGYSYGNAVEYGNVYDLDIIDSQFSGGGRGVSSLCFGSSYPIRVSGNKFLSQSDCGYFGSFDQTSGEDNEFTYCGTCAIRHKISVAHWTRSFITPPGGGVPLCMAAVMFHGGSGASVLTLDDSLVDFEGSANPAPLWAYVWIQGSQSGVRARIKGLTCGRLPNGSDIIRCVSYTQGPITAPMEITASDITASGASGRSVLSVDGPQWQGRIFGSLPAGLTPVVNKGSGRQNVWPEWQIPTFTSDPIGAPIPGQERQYNSANGKLWFYTAAGWISR